MFARSLSSFVVGALFVADCMPVAAQTTGSARPFHGALFGVHSAQNSTQKLDVSAMLLQAYDDNVFATLGSNVAPGSGQVSGFFNMLQPAVDYRLTHARVQVGLTGASAMGYYPQFHELKSISHTAGAGVALDVARKATVFLNQTAAYSPSYLYSLFPGSIEMSPGDPAPDAPNYAVNDVESFSYGTTARFSYGLTQRMSASVGGNYQYTDYVHETSVRQDLISHGLDGQLSYQRTRNLSFRAVYRYTAGNLSYGSTGSADEHGLEGGISYSRPLSATRSATFSFSLGSSAASTISASIGPQFPDRLYRASADAAFDYEFALAWRASGRYRRGFEFVPGLAQPVFTDGFSAALEGLLKPRVEIGLMASYSQGASALSAAASQFNTNSASVRLQYALTSSTAIHVEYVYYFYDFLGDVTLVSGAPPRMQRNAVRAGLRLLFPAFRG